MRVHEQTDVLARGTVLGGRYRISDVVGSGAMGRLYGATRLADGRPVVLKLLFSVGPRGRAGLKQEARALAMLDHPNVVGFVEYAEAGNVAFVAMEALRGQDLEARIRSRRVTRTGALVWLYQLAAALDHVHARGLVHRDIKPANVVIESSGTGDRAVLVDFGLAKSHPRTTSERNPVVCVMGTPQYMAPEQALGLEGEIGPAADRYALAAIALELLTGERPYPALPLGRLLVAILEDPPRRPSALGFGGTELDQVFARAMAREPARRHPSARAFVEDLVDALPATGVGALRSGAIQAAPTVRAKAA